MNSAQFEVYSIMHTGLFFPVLFTKRFV